MISLALHHHHVDQVGACGHRRLDLAIVVGPVRPAGAAAAWGAEHPKRAEAGCFLSFVSAAVAVAENKDLINGVIANQAADGVRLNARFRGGALAALPAADAVRNQALAFAVIGDQAAAGEAAFFALAGGRGQRAAGRPYAREWAGGPGAQPVAKATRFQDLVEDAVENGNQAAARVAVIERGGDDQAISYGWDSSHRRTLSTDVTVSITTESPWESPLRNTKTPMFLAFGDLVTVGDSFSALRAYECAGGRGCGRMSGEWNISHHQSPSHHGKGTTISHQGSNHGSNPCEGQKPQQNTGMVASGGFHPDPTHDAGAGAGGHECGRR